MKHDRRSVRSLTEATPFCTTPRVNDSGAAQSFPAHLHHFLNSARKMTSDHHLHEVSGAEPSKGGWWAPACTLVLLLAVDIWVYDGILTMCSALLGSLIGDTFVKEFVVFEMFIIIAVTMFIFFGLFNLNLEHRFWRHLFSPDKSYLCILYIREFFNIFSLGCFLTLLMSVVSSPAGIKKNTLGEILWNTINNFAINTYMHLPCYMTGMHRRGHDLPTLVDTSWTWTSKPPSDFKNIRLAKAFNSAYLVIAIAGTTACVMKAIYFVTLHNYLRAMHIFAEMARSKSPPESRAEGGSFHEVISAYLSENMTSTIKPRSFDDSPSWDNDEIPMSHSPVFHTQVKPHAH